MTGRGGIWTRQSLTVSPHTRQPARWYLDSQEGGGIVHILGINAYHGNASAALVSGGQLIAAVEEERFNRVKYAAGFPAAAIRYCLEEGGITLADVSHVAIPRDPWAR